ncbi:6-phosphogluconolactonase [Rathayibacter soli]|uniref:6-phosphogluconolactonase n=1 Tax=Rathayibacter soli TaxID=3144168 RepID=UPI0027E4ABFC|nr:6-phosphogluconolactonase [Glaciibacter superstes]
MQVTAQIFETPDDVGQQAALLIADAIVAAGDRPFVLGCPSGRSPVSTYRALAAETTRRRLDLSRVVIALMDEYVELDPPGYRLVDAGRAHSCVGFGRREIVAPLSAAAGPGKGITPDNLWFPQLENPGDYDRKLEAAGGIDVFLLATGASDGHIALNPIGSDRQSMTRIVELEESTRRDNLDTFPSFTGLDDVPRVGATVGIQTIQKLSRTVIMIALGEQKSEAVRRISAATEYDPSWPATILSECNSPLFLIDRAAAALLEPIA